MLICYVMFLAAMSSSSSDNVTQSVHLSVSPSVCPSVSFFGMCFNQPKIKYFDIPNQAVLPILLLIIDVIFSCDEFSSSDKVTQSVCPFVRPWPFFYS